MRVGLDHAHLFASDIATTIAFFRDALGATVVWDEMAAGARNVRLQLGRAFVQLYEQPPRGHAGVVHHLGVETDDLDALVARVRACGYAPRDPIREEPRFRYAMIAGPDGLLLELFECREPGRWRIER